MMSARDMAGDDEMDVAETSPYKRYSRTCVTEYEEAGAQEADDGVIFVELFNKARSVADRMRNMLGLQS